MSFGILAIHRVTQISAGATATSYYGIGHRVHGSPVVPICLRNEDLLASVKRHAQRYFLRKLLFPTNLNIV